MHCSEVKPANHLPEDLRSCSLWACSTTEEYVDSEFSYEATMQFVEVGSCTHEPFLIDGEDMHLFGRQPLLCLGCKVDGSGVLEKRRTILITNVSALSEGASLHVIL